MSSEDSLGVTLALVDPSLLSSWEAMVKRGEECSLVLKHSQGKITAMLQCTTPSPRSTLSSLPSSTPSAERRKKTKGSKEKRLKALLAYHQCLVVEKGLPPSRLMEQHAAVSAIAPASPDQSPGLKEKQFQCDQCDFSSDSLRGLKVHAGRCHKVQPSSEILREDLEVSLTLSQLSVEQTNDISSVNADTSSTLDDIELPSALGRDPAEKFGCKHCELFDFEKEMRLHVHEVHGKCRIKLESARFTTPCPWPNCTTPMHVWDLK